MGESGGAYEGDFWGHATSLTRLYMPTLALFAILLISDLGASAFRLTGHCKRHQSHCLTDD